MSIWDSFGSLEDEAVEDLSSRPSADRVLDILDSFAELPTDVMVGERPLDRGDPHDTAQSKETASELQPPLETAKPKSSRGRKRGSTNEAMDLRRLLSGDQTASAAGHGPRAKAKARHEICSAAGKASARKRRGEALGPAYSAPPVASSQSAQPSLALVPWQDAPRAGPYLFNNEAAQHTIVEFRPKEAVRKKSGIKVEAGILQSGLSLMSKSELAKKLKVSRKTVTKRLRLLAVAIMLVRKLRTAGRFEEAYQVLLITYSGMSVEKMLFLLKYKYDEMSIRCNATVNGKQETSVTKLLQVQLWWTALYKVGGQYVRYRAQLPTCVRSVEKCNLNCFRAALDGHVKFPAIADDFKRKCRLPLADKHATNTAVDQSYFRDASSEVLHKWNCFSHVEHKIADKTCEIFPNERRGLLHFCLSVNFAGTLAKLKSAMKKRNRENFSFYEASEAGPGAHHDAFREAVFRQCCEVKSDDHRETNTGTLMMVHRRKRLWNGRYKRQGLTDHYCRGCHSSAESCLTEMDEAIDEEPGPGDWCPSRFMRVEDTIDWALFWKLCHALLDLAIYDVMEDVKASASSRALAEPLFALLDEEHGADDSESEHELHLPEDDIGLAEVMKDSTEHEKQSTFRKNTLLWTKSKCCGRLWAFKSILRVQQAGQRFIAMNSGAKWTQREQQRRLEGKQPTYRVVLAAQGAFHKPAMRAWSLLMSTEDAWTGMPLEFHRHDLSVQTFRGLSAALCTKFELEVTVLESSEVQGYLILETETLGTADMAAMKLAHAYEHDPCTLGPQWYAHCAEFPTVEALRSSDSLALAACKADEIELDNLGVEAHNANLYRTVKRAVQQKLAKVEDISAGWVIRNDRLVHTSLWGSKKYTADEIATEVTMSVKKVLAGGGGLCRAFVSMMSPLYKYPNGKSDFSTIMALYKIEKEKPSSDVLNGLKETAKEATSARKEQIEKGQRWQISAFGKVSQTGVRSAQREADLQRLLDVVHPPELLPLCDRDPSAHSLQIVPAIDPSVTGRIVQFAGHKLGDQLAVFRRVGRHHASSQRKALEASEAKVRAGLVAPKPLLGKQLALSEHSASAVRTSPSGMFFDIFFHDDCCHEVMQKVATMCKSNSRVVEACEVLWRRDHEMVTDEGAPDVGTIPSSAKPTFCYLNGAGSCLCKGRGLLLSLFAMNLATVVCRRAPKDSELRKLLKGAWVVFNIGVRYATGIGRMIVCAYFRGNSGAWRGLRGPSRPKRTKMRFDSRL